MPSSARLTGIFADWQKSRLSKRDAMASLPEDLRLPPNRKWKSRRETFLDRLNRWSRNVNRGEPRCTFVNEIVGLPLAMSVFPKVYDFAGDAVLSLVEPGLYKKGCATETASRSRTSTR